ncbi:HNH endonuclease signature motif containing protein, partial [Agrococcus pavilionensis]|uniref:HNH endonuclease signature motif containing protein n=1 Tax=Agrococcus pavilionensis TaxID=1346502 RepID=UPI0004CFE405
EWSGIDAEEYIASIRAGAIDPRGRTADELEEELAAYDRDWAERLARLSDAEVEEVIAGRMEVPPLPGTMPAAERPESVRRQEALAGRIRAIEQRRARLEAEHREVLAAELQHLRESGGDVGMAVKESASILAAELRLSDRAMERKLVEAWTTVIDLPAAHASHKEGRITGTHLRAIEQATEALRTDPSVDPEDRARVEAELVEIAERVTPSQLRSRARRIVDRAMAEPLQRRHDRAVEQRRAWVEDHDDGISTLSLSGPSVTIHGAFNRATDAARGKPKDDPRTFDQYRFDALMETLLTGQTPEDLHGINPISATVTVTIPATELLKRSDDEDEPQLRFSGALEGGALVDAATVRALASETITWERLFLHPVTGVPVAVDTYKPNRAMRRWLQRRDGRCRWPGCTNRVSRADADHTIAHADGGPTTLSNLAHLCRRHHSMKHATAWTVRQLDQGVLEWTSPTGKIYLDEPEPAGPAFVDRGVDIWDLSRDQPAKCTASDPPWAHLKDCTCELEDATA